MASMELALAALRSADPGEKPNISLVARTYGVSQSGLYKRFHGVTGSKEEQYDKQRILTTTQSRALIKWINQLTERGLPPTNSMLANFAREISGKEPGKNWASRWLKAHSDKVISRYSTGLDSDRKKADSAYKYALYFELIGRKIRQYNLGPEQIYNMDEKGFMLGVSTKRKRIFTRRKYEQGGYKQHLQDGNRKWITTIGSFRTTGLYPFDPEIPAISSESGASIIPPEDWRRLEKLVKTVVNNIYDEKAIQLRETVSHLSTQLILLQNENQGLKRALINSKKPKKKKQPLLLGLPSEQDGGALFMSPTKVQQARDIISQKNDEAAQKQAHKDDKKLQQQLKKQAREAEKVERAQIRQEKREQREQEAAEKQRLKDEQELAKLADLQLQNDVIATPKASKRPTKQISRQAKPRAQPEAHVEDNEVVVTTNRRGRAIRPPALLSSLSFLCPSFPETLCAFPTTELEKMVFQYLLDCISSTLAAKPPLAQPSSSPSPASIASDILTIILAADSPYTLHKHLNERLSTESWSEDIATALLLGLENAIKTGAQMAKASLDALAQAKDTAIGFAEDHPVYATLIALGILAILMPWALEILGFGDLGPIEGSFAALWQSKYAGYVPKKSLFSYFQRLGMKWHWIV
ncbi:conserved hypothetical protein [Talaromyces stipitatus ATCC 10500]|uniref:HTH CENPB-type domain-containing protein n=1 Tax=Talaromyces stipitatus (strain ATCC 10500 / CBS 375.48 / QM 6759 / NRRL 1006) TaxID=441959 RepID=B8LX98_TALSN|nr:uncharacterized protein TSTA_066290 [Talaromyces stipitatus ATCC 10500]EED23179.1 conserved hypothetical protein [Talaromyces stipitatus ATCC 10500]